MRRIDTLENKYPDAGKDWRQEEKGTTEDEMAGWHHWLDGHESDKQALGAGDGMGKPGVLQSMGSQKSYMTGQLNWTDNWQNHKNLITVVKFAIKNTKIFCSMRKLTISRQ